MSDRPSVRVTSDLDHEDEQEGSDSILRSPIDVSSELDQSSFSTKRQNAKASNWFASFFRSVPSWPRKDVSLSSMLTGREITLRRMKDTVEFWTITPLTRFSTGNYFFCQSRPRVHDNLCVSLDKSNSSDLFHFDALYYFPEYEVKLTLAFGWQNL